MNDVFTPSKHTHAIWWKLTFYTTNYLKQTKSTNYRWVLATARIPVVIALGFDKLAS